MSHGINKITADRNQRALIELVQAPGNDVCADCKARAPRWASYNLGIFICVNCASIHRKMGTHISKVKSINMDTWSKEQVEVMKQKGNLKSNSYYNPNETRNRPPTNMIEQERDSELEKYIRGKYEFKRFIDQSTTGTTQPGPPRSSSSQFPPTPQSKSVPARPSTAAGPSITPARGASLGYRPATAAGVQSVSQPSQVPVQPNRSASQPLPSQAPQHASPSALQKPSNDPVWNDLISLQGPSATSSLPLQYQHAMPTNGFTQPMAVTNTNTYASASDGSPFGVVQMTTTNSVSPAGGGMPIGSMAAGIALDPNMGSGIGGINPFQQSNFNAPFSHSAGPSLAPNSFSQSYLSTGTTGVTSPLIGMGQSLPQPSPFQSQIQPFSQTPAAQQFQASLQSQSQPQTFFQPQPQPPGMQAHQPFGQQPSPFGQQPSPYGQQQPSPFGQQPSPFGHQPSPHLQQPQQPQQMLTPGNAFGNWQQQPGGYPGQQGAFGGQQWGGM